jgi:stearoyl-CoA desaturase (delta-9 desaturase)
VADDKTLEALIANRYEIMAGYARGMRGALQQELDALKARSNDAAMVKTATRWLHRDEEKVPASALPQLAQARAASPVLDKMVTMRAELRQLWLNTSLNREQMLTNLQAWCLRAEESGIAALQDFSRKLRAAQA